MAEGYKSRHTGAAIDNAVGRVERVPAAENDKYLHINASGEPEWSSIVVDDAMSSSSENPVQNKVVKSYIDSLASTALQRKIVSPSGSGYRNERRLHDFETRRRGWRFL